MTTAPVRFEPDGSVLRVVLTGEIDIRASELVTDEVLATHATDGELVIDATAVTFVDSVGLALLLRLRQIAAGVRLVAPPATLVRLLEITGCTPLFPTDDPVRD